VIEVVYSNNKVNRGAEERNITPRQG